MMDLNTSHNLGRVFGHLEIIEVVLCKMLTELKVSTPETAGIATRVEEAMAAYEKSKSDFVRMANDTPEEHQRAEEHRFGLKAGRRKAVSLISGSGQ